MELQGFTCLMGACTNEDAQMVQLLVTKGADIHARDGTEVRPACSTLDPFMEKGPAISLHLHQQNVHTDIILAAFGLRRSLYDA